ncbi:hypothetical protein F511_33425 [Dorcoceras hygrometricum]|uniref:Uncharacterized protein n=1 Tax=Dorcoceras hygrometricum TaxID=472368 RepID=A0A2Z7DCF1_9LAMI|nr:hypothetical protein F511_33425 [Dorcoceras hygrometricum]
MLVEDIVARADPCNSSTSKELEHGFKFPDDVMICTFATVSKMILNVWQRSFVTVRCWLFKMTDLYEGRAGLVRALFWFDKLS